MNQRFALAFLILLRLAIGWHFLFESLEKHRTVYDGPSETNRPWTSEPFFREGRGPLAAVMRWQLGDPDQQALARMTVRPGEPPAQRLPAALDAEWDDYFQRFSKHYRLDGPQSTSAFAKLQEQKEKTAVWFTTR